TAAARQTFRRAVGAFSGRRQGAHSSDGPVANARVDPPGPGLSPVYLPPFAIPGKPPMQSLPIDAVLPDLRAALASRDEAVLEAPPGAGKTTRVPLALLDEPWLAGQRILMLEPRRLAARAAAERLASELGEAVGETVGY